MNWEHWIFALFCLVCPFALPVMLSLAVIGFCAKELSAALFPVRAYFEGKEGIEP